MNSNPFRTFFQSLFNIRPGEGFRVGIMFLYSLGAIGGVIILGRSVSRTLFLSTLPESATPYKFILPPFFIVLVTFLYTRITHRFKPYRLIIGSNLLMMAGTLIFRFLIEFPFSDQIVFLASLYVYFEVMASLVGIQFWTFAADIFTPREAKRLFSLIAAGGVLANVLAGASLRLLADVLLPKDLIFAVVASLLGGGVCVWVLGRRESAEDAVLAPRRSSGKSKEGENTSIREDIQALRRSPLLVSIGSIMIVMSLVTNLADFQLDLSLQRYFSGDGPGMISFLGIFSLLTGIGAIILQFFATGRVLEKLGLLVGLLVLPLGMALGSTAFLITGGALWAMALPRGADYLFRYTISDASLNVLFLPVRSDLRRRAKAIIDGIIKPPLIGLLGLLLPLFLSENIDITGVQAKDVVPWSFVILLLIAVWWFLVLRVRRQYTDALSESLNFHRLALDETELDLSDETSRQVLVTHFQNPDAIKVIHALQIVGHADTINWSPHVIQLLSHPSEDVRIMALRHLEQSHQRFGSPPDYEEKIATHFSDPAPAVAAAAIETYCALQGQAAISQVKPFLEKPDLGTKSAAVVGLMKYAGLDGILEAAIHLKQMLEGSDIALRQAGANILGSLKIQNFYQPLIPLLEDGSKEVQVKAIHAAGLVRHPALIPHLIPKLGFSGTVSATKGALISYGPGIETELGRTLEMDNHKDIRLQIPRVLRQIHTQESALVLLDHLNEPDDYVRGIIFKSLATLQSKGVDFPVQREKISWAIAHELGQIYRFYMVRSDLQVEDHNPLILHTLTERIRFAMDRLFFLLSLYYPDQDAGVLRQALDSEDQRLRANAIELLDNFAEKDIKEPLLPIIEANDEQIKSLAEKNFNIYRQSPLERLKELAEGPDPWLRSIALHQIGVFNLTELQDSVLAALDSQVDLVVETALWASERLLSPEIFQEILATQDFDGLLFPDGGPNQTPLKEESEMALSTVERVLQLRSVELFSQVSSEDLIAVAQACQEVHFESGEQFITAGEIGDCLYVIVAGEVNVESGEKGRVISQVRQDIIGEMAIITRKPRSANCIATTEVTALKIDYDDFWVLMEEKHELALGVMKVLTERLDIMDKKFSELEREIKV